MHDFKKKKSYNAPWGHDVMSWRLMSMGMDMHAYGMYAWVWIYGCIAEIYIRMQRCNMHGWCGSGKL